MNVGPLTGTSEINSAQSLSGMSATGNVSGKGDFMGHTVTLSNQSVVNPSELGSVFSSGKSLSERHVEIATAQG
jgi:hypothetical protein